MSYQNQPGEVYNYGGDRYASGNYSNVNPSGNYGNINAPQNPQVQGNQAYGNTGYQAPQIKPYGPGNQGTYNQGGYNQNPSGFDRFSSYLPNANDYKYNCFSAIDEPWNKCVSGLPCGKCPGNECIASEPLKTHWI